MKVYYLGTCSGTEPMPGMHHCSLIFEIDGTNYWFDAGEGCAHTAYTMGINIMNTKCLFISHPHPDHTCGLPALLMCINKLTGRYKQTLKHDNTLRTFIPSSTVLEGARMLASTSKRYKIDEHGVEDGVVFDERGVKVSAVHNKHLKEPEGGAWHSFSYLIEADGKRAVFSGDVLEPCELDPLVEGGCDLLIMETGHHPVSAVCDYALSRGIKTLRFNHHGREILEGREAAEKYVSDFGAENGMDIKLCYDRMTEEL